MAQRRAALHPRAKRGGLSLCRFVSRPDCQSSLDHRAAQQREIHFVGRIAEADILTRVAGCGPVVVEHLYSVNLIGIYVEHVGLTCGLSAGMRRRECDPVYDRGQVLIDLALMLIAGGEAISDFQSLAHLAPVIGPVPSTPTVWRTLNETGDLQLARVNVAVAEFRRHWWGLLASRPEGFPWLKVAGKGLTGITVIDLDASIVLAGSDKENAKATYKGGTGFCPNLATCDNTGDMLAIDPRPGNSASNCARHSTP